MSSPNTTSKQQQQEEKGASDRDSPLAPDNNTIEGHSTTLRLTPNPQEEAARNRQASIMPPAANQEARCEVENAPLSATGLAYDVGSARKETKPTSVDLSQEETESNISSNPVPGGSKRPIQTGGDEAVVDSNDSDFIRQQRKMHQSSEATPVDLTVEVSEDGTVDDSNRVLMQASVSETKEADGHDTATKALSVKRTGEDAGDGEISSTGKSNEGSGGTGRDQTAPVLMGVDGAAPTSTYSSSEVQTLSTMTMELPLLAPGEYDTLLPTTTSGMMIKVKHRIFDGTATFNGYNQFPNGSKAPAELRSLCGNIGDQIIAVDGASVLDKNGRDIINMLRACGKKKHVHLRFKINGSTSSLETNPSEGERARGQEQNEAHRISDLDGPQKADQSVAMHSLNETKLPAENKFDNADQATGRDDLQNNNELAFTVSAVNTATKDAEDEEISSQKVNVESLAEVTIGADEEPASSELQQKAKDPASILSSVDQTGENTGGVETSIQKVLVESISHVRDEVASIPMDVDGAAPTSTYFTSEVQLLSTLTMALPPLASGEYDTLLPSTTSGMMIKVKHRIFDGTATFNGYNQFPNGSKAPAELRSLCGNIGDQIIAVDGASVLDKNGRDIINMLHACGKKKHVHLRFRLNASTSSLETNPSEGERARGQEQNEAHRISDLDGPQKADQSVAMHSLNETKLPAENKFDNADQATGRDDLQNNKELAFTVSAVNTATKDAEDEEISSQKVNVESVAEAVMGAGEEPSSSELLQKAKNPASTTSSVDQTGESTGVDETSTQKVLVESISHVRDQTSPVAQMDVDETSPASSDAVSSDAQTLTTMTTALPPLAAEEYDTLLPNTKREVMFKIAANLIDESASFNEYVRFPNGLRAPAELGQLCGNIGDRVIAVDGASVLDKNCEEIVDITREAGINKQLHIRFRTEMSESPISTSATPTEGEGAIEREQKEILHISDSTGPQKSSQSLTANSLDQTEEHAGMKSGEAEKALGVDGPQKVKVLCGDGGSSIQQVMVEIIGADKEPMPADPIDVDGTAAASSDAVSSDAQILATMTTALPPLAAGEYDTLLPITKHGIMMNVKHSNEDGTAAFSGYVQINGVKGPAELQNLCRNIGDRLVAIDGLSVLEKDSREIVAILREKNKQVHVRFRTKMSDSPITTYVKLTEDELLGGKEHKVTLPPGITLPFESAPRQRLTDGPLLQRGGTKDAIISKNPLPQQLAFAGTPDDCTPTKRDRTQSSTAGLAMLEALQNEAGVTLTSSLAPPKNITKLYYDAHSQIPIVKAHHFSPLGGTTRSLPPTDKHSNTISAATLHKQRPTNNGAAPRTTFIPLSTPDRTNVAASKTIVRNSDTPDLKRRRLKTTDLTGKKMRTIHAKWNNEYHDREFRSITAVTYAMELNDVQQQEQARKYLRADNVRFRRAQERKNRLNTSTTPTAQREKRPPPAARTDLEAKRRKQMPPKRRSLVYPGSGPTTNAKVKDDTIWLSTSAGGDANTGYDKGKSPRMAPKMVYEGAPTVDAFQTESSWPEAWKATKQWPGGWVLRIYERRGGVSKGQVDRYWFSPKTKKKLRSVVKIKRFVEFVGLCDGDEDKAWARLRTE